MEKTLFNAVYDRKKRLLANGTALVQVEAYLRGKNKYFSTKIYLTPDQWDKKHRKVKNHPNAIRLNKQIKDQIAKYEDFELERLNSGKPFTLDILSDFVNGKVTNDFVKFMSTEIDNEVCSTATTTSQKTTLAALKEFRSVILFSEMDYELLTDFEKFLYGKGLGVNTINKYFRHVRKFVNIAINKKLMDLNKYPFREFKAKSETTEREYLQPEELELLEALKLSKENAHLQKVLDMFLFSCYCGLRFSDLVALSRDKIVTKDGNIWIDTRMIKTNEPIKIPLYLLFQGKPIEILNKYIDTDRKFIFDELTNQYVNRCLKDIAKLAEITKNLTFHTARHTQATYMLYKGVSIKAIQKLLGHKKLETTQIYAKIMDKSLVNELEAVNY